MSLLSTLKAFPALRVYDAVEFKALKEGELFMFAVDYMWHQKHLCQKISTRKYLRDDKPGKVNSIHAVVLRLDENNQPIKVSSYTPYLGD